MNGGADGRGEARAAVESKRREYSNRRAGWIRQGGNGGSSHVAIPPETTRTGDVNVPIETRVADAAADAADADAARDAMCRSAKDAFA